MCNGLIRIHDNTYIGLVIFIIMYFCSFNNESWFTNSLRLAELNIAAGIHSIQAYQKQYSDQNRRP